MTELTAVMYHYVRPPTERPPSGYYHLALEDFRRQLDYLETEYGVIDRDTFVELLHGGREAPEGVVLTFDDALADHHEWVFSELRRRGLWGLFFIPTGPYSDGRLLPVHRVHDLVASVPAAELRDELAAVLRANTTAFETEQDIEDGYTTQSSADAVSEFKRLVNFTVRPSSVHGVLDTLEARLDEYEPPTAAEYYLSESELTEMADTGMLVGAHSKTHPVLTRLDADSQRAEVTDSVTWIAERVGSQPVSTFAYPFGGNDTFTSETVDAVTDAGCDAAFTTESGTITGAIAPNDDAFALPRRDCNEFEYGGATFELP